MYSSCAENENSIKSYAPESVTNIPKNWSTVGQNRSSRQVVVMKPIAGDKPPIFGVKIQNQKGKNIFLDALLPPKQRAPITINGKLLKIVQYNSQMQTSNLQKVPLNKFHYLTQAIQAGSSQL